MGHLQVAVTRLPFLRGERVIDFPSSDHLKSALLASAAAFPAAPLVFRSGSWYVDGGLTDFQPVVDDTTLTISPFYFSDCDIKPSRYVPLWWAFLPPRSSDTVDWLYSLGFHDTMTYFAQKGIAETTRSRPQLRSVFKNPHPYDIPRRVSVNRFLGYDVGNLTHEYVSFLMDFVLLVLLVVVWRPAALLLIYVELWAQLTVELVSSLIAESYTTLPLSLFSFLMFQNWVVTGWVSALVCVEKVLIFGFSTVASKKLRNCGDYFSCIFSLSLMLRFLRPACPREVLRKHQRLAKISILYRVFCHMI